MEDVDGAAGGVLSDLVDDGAGVRVDRLAHLNVAHLGMVKKRHSLKIKMQLRSCIQSTLQLQSR